MTDGKNGSRDDFWDIEKLVPRKRASLSPFVSENPARDYSLSEKKDTAERVAPEERKLSFSDRPSFRTTEEESYIPDGHGFIKSVKVIRLIDRYDFYEGFRKAALIYFDYKTDKCDFAQFYSFMPQYSQLGPQQKSYYFYWRGELRSGRYIKTDYSYLYLYVYEILNLPDKIPPKEGLSLLCEVWRAYRGSLPRLDLYFSIWVQDYCLVHRLPCPTEEISDFIFDVISVSSFKEFYLSDINNAGSGGVIAMLAYLSDYDWRKGKFVSGPEGTETEKRNEIAGMYRAHMEGAMTLLLRGLWDELMAKKDSAGTGILRRDAFPNSLLTHSVKSKLEIEYYPIGAAADMRRGITAAVRYTENKIRALMSVKSRLAVRDLPDDYRRIIDYYFEAIFDGERRRIAKENAPEYERLYDAPKEELSFAGADEIERLSWETTVRLVDTEEELSEWEEPVTEEPPVTEALQTETEEEDLMGLDSEAVGYLASLLGTSYPGAASGLSSIDRISVAERINEAFYDLLGDVVLEEDGGEYRIIDDYYEDIRQWLTKIMK